MIFIKLLSWSLVELLHFYHIHSFKSKDQSFYEHEHTVFVQIGLRTCSRGTHTTGKAWTKHLRLMFLQHFCSPTPYSFFFLFIIERLYDMIPSVGQVFQRRRWHRQRRWWFPENGRWRHYPTAPPARCRRPKVLLRRCQAYQSPRPPRDLIFPSFLIFPSPRRVNIWSEKIELAFNCSVGVPLLQ